MPDLFGIVYSELTSRMVEVEAHNARFVGTLVHPATLAQQITVAIEAARSGRYRLNMPTTDTPVNTGNLPDLAGLELRVMELEAAVRQLACNMAESEPAFGFDALAPRLIARHGFPLKVVLPTGRPRG